MHVDRIAISGLAQERDHALRLAQQIGTDQMGALRKKRDRMQKLADFGLRIAVTENRQAECRLGDEHVAGHALE